MNDSIIYRAATAILQAQAFRGAAACSEERGQTDDAEYARRKLNAEHGIAVGLLWGLFPEQTLSGQTSWNIVLEYVRSATEGRWNVSKAPTYVGEFVEAIRAKFPSLD